MKTAIVVGATGAIGKQLLYQLLEHSDYLRVFAITRKPLPIKHHKLTNQVVDFEQLGNTLHSLQADVAYCCLGTTMKQAGSKEAFYQVDYTYVYQVAQQLKQNQVNAFVMVSAMGAHSQSAIFYNKVKGEIEEAVKNLQFESTIIVRPSLLLAKRSEFRLGEWIAQKLMRLLGFLFMGPLKNYKAIPVQTVARAMVNLAQANNKGIFIVENAALFEWSKKD